MDDIPTPASETSASNQNIASKHVSPDSSPPHNDTSTPTADSDVSAASDQDDPVGTPAQVQTPNSVQRVTSTPTATSTRKVALPHALTWTTPSSNKSPPRSIVSRSMVLRDNIPTRVRWSDEMTEALLTTLADKAAKLGKRNDTGYQKFVWRHAREVVQQVAGDSVLLTEQHCKSKHDSCKLDWKAWEKLRKVPGFAVNGEGVAFVSSPEMEAHYLQQKECRKFFKQPFPFEELHARLFGGIPLIQARSRKRPGSASIDETRRDGIAPEDRASAPVFSAQTSTSIPAGQPSTPTGQSDSTRAAVDLPLDAEDQQRKIISDLAQKMGDHATASKIRAVSANVQHREATTAPPAASNPQPSQEAPPVPVPQSSGTVPTAPPPSVATSANPQHRMEVPRFDGPPKPHHQYNMPPPTHQPNGPPPSYPQYAHPQPVAPSPTLPPHGYPTFPAQYIPNAHPPPSHYPPPTYPPQTFTPTAPPADPLANDQLHNTLQSFSSKLTTLSDAMSRQNPNLETQRAAQVLMERTFDMDEELQVAMAMHVFNQDTLASSFLAWGSAVTQKVWLKKQLERLVREGLLDGSNGVEERIREVRLKAE